jgi:hypothetical protein
MLALAVLFAAVFFFAGYAVRTSRTEAASLRAATPPPPDGNPSGHHLWPQYSATVSVRSLAAAPGSTAQSPPDLKKCLGLLASGRVEIFYVTAKHGQQPHLPKPTCTSGKVCQTFVWKNMWTTTWKPSPDYGQNGTELVDVYGALTVK